MRIFQRAVRVSCRWCVFNSRRQTINRLGWPRPVGKLYYQRTRNDPSPGCGRQCSVSNLPSVCCVNTCSFRRRYARYSIVVHLSYLRAYQSIYFLRLSRVFGGEFGIRGPQRAGNLVADCRYGCCCRCCWCCWCFWVGPGKPKCPNVVHCLCSVHAKLDHMATELSLQVWLMFSDSVARNESTIAWYVLSCVSQWFGCRESEIRLGSAPASNIWHKRWHRVVEWALIKFYSNQCVYYGYRFELTDQQI